MTESFIIMVCVALIVVALVMRGLATSGAKDVGIPIPAMMPRHEMIDVTTIADQARMHQPRETTVQWRSTCEGCGAPLQPHDAQCPWCLRASGNDPVQKPWAILEVNGVLSEEGARRVRQAWEDRYTFPGEKPAWK